MRLVGRSLVVAFFLFLAVVSQTRGFYVSLVSTAAVALLFFIDRIHYPKRFTDRQVRAALVCAAVAAVVLFVVEANVYAPPQSQARQ